eukprot:scaffold23262_cov220-Cylindrotheca_fusiformis.AAC.1
MLSLFFVHNRQTELVFSSLDIAFAIFTWIFGHHMLNIAILCERRCNSHISDDFLQYQIDRTTVLENGELWLIQSLQFTYPVDFLQNQCDRMEYLKIK